MTPIYAMVVVDGVEYPHLNPRERHQWTAGGLALWIPRVPLDLGVRLHNCVITGITKTDAGYQVGLHPTGQGKVAFGLSDEPDNYFVYDPPLPG